ncbi:MAG: hypothetical protein ACFE9Q_03815 [Candidatus Hodarchaeota archaeon]
MILFPTNPVWFSLKFINAMRTHEKCIIKPSVRQAIAMCKLIFARFLNRGMCDIEDFLEVAVVTSPLENQDLAKQIARELLTYLDPLNNTISSEIQNLDIFDHTKPKDLIDDISKDFSDLDEIYDDLELLKNYFVEIEGLDLETMMDSTFNTFFNRFARELEEDPYKTALDVIERNAIVHFDEIPDLKSLLEKAKGLLRKKVNHLEPEDINFARKLGILDEIIKKSSVPREKILSQFVKNKDLSKDDIGKVEVDNLIEFKKSLENTFKKNFYDALSLAEFGLKGKILDSTGKETMKELLKNNLKRGKRNLNDLFRATKVMGSNLDFEKQEIDNIIKNSLDLPFKDALQSVKNYDQYFGGVISDKYLEKVSTDLDSVDKKHNFEDIRKNLIKNPIKTPSWRKLLSKTIDKEVQELKISYVKPGVLNAQMKNLADTLIASQDNCSDFVCKSQLSNKIQEVVNKTTEIAVNKNILRNIVKNFNEMGFLPNINSIKKAGKQLKMSEAEILSMIEANFKYFKRMVEEHSLTYQAYKDYLKKLKLSPQQVEQIIRSAMGAAPPKTTNMDALSALSEKFLSQVLNIAEDMGDAALESALSSLGAGSGLDLLEQWFFSRHNISIKVKTKLKEIIKHIMIDLGIRSANSLIGSANSGPIVENIVIPYTPGDDFELIDLEESVSNLLEGGKTVDLISNDDFLVAKTSQGLRCLVLELDISGSMTGLKLSQMALCATMLVYAFKPEELALTFFESNTHRIKNLDEGVELEKVVDELLDIQARGGTCINSALKWANHQFEKKARSKHKLNVLFTDADIFDFKNSLNELKKMREKDVKFVMVVPKFNFSPVMAKKMVEEASGVLLTLNQWREFPKLISEIITNQ